MLKASKSQTLILYLFLDKCLDIYISYIADISEQTLNYLHNYSVNTEQ